MKRLTIAPGQPDVARSGVTLTEVLMSLMIMSIGVSLVASLFPVAALRSAQATKLTNAAILKYNVETIVDLLPELLFDPDGDYNPTAALAIRRAALVEHFGSPPVRNYIVDPNGYIAHAEAGLTFDAPSAPTSSGFCSWFGNNGNTVPYAGGAGSFGLRRYDGGLQSGFALLSAATPEQVRAMRLIAAQRTGLGSGWDTVIDEAIDLADVSLTGAGGTSDGITFAADVDLSAVVSSENMIPRNAGAMIGSDPELYQITVFSGDEKLSQTFPLTRINGQTCFWTESAEDLNGNGYLDTSRPLPSEFNGTVARAMIQVKRTNDFNWLLTVRRGGDGRVLGTDVVVTFSSGVTPDDEWAYVTATDKDDDGNFEGGFVRGQFFVEFSYTDAMPEPSLRRGGFVLDVHNGRWYRVQDYVELTGVNTSSAAATGTTAVQLRLEQSAIESSPPGSRVIFLPTVVDVYPLGGRSLPRELEEITFR